MNSLLGLAIPMGRTREAPAVPQPDAAAATLRERLAALTAPVPDAVRERGTVVIYKRGFDPRRDPDNTLPMIVVGGDPKDYEKSDLIHRFGRADVVVMEISPNGIATFEVVDARMLEPWPRQGEPSEGAVAASEGMRVRFYGGGRLMAEQTVPQGTVPDAASLPMVEGAEYIVINHATIGPIRMDLSTADPTKAIAINVATAADLPDEAA